MLAACGSTPAPGTGGASVSQPTVGPMRPVTSQPVAADGALECPANLADDRGRTVPEKPQGVDGNARLVPDREPESLVVCRYPVLDLMTGSLEAPFALASRHVVPASDRQTVVDLLTWAPRGTTEGRACTAMAGNESVHLVGAMYGDAVVWVVAKADANSCSGATNGDFESRAPVGVSLERIYGEEPGPVTPPAEQATCGGWSMGRLGDDQTLVPEGSPVVTVCRLAVSGSWQETQLDEERSARVVTELRQLAVRPTLGTCEGADPAADDAFRLVLTYPRGPSVHIGVTPSCRPPVLGGGVESPDVGGLVELVEQWSPPVPAPDPDAPVSSDGSGSPEGTGDTGDTGTGGSVDPVAPRTRPPFVPDATATTVP